MENPTPECTHEVVKRSDPSFPDQWLCQACAEPFGMLHVKARWAQRIVVNRSGFRATLVIDGQELPWYIAREIDAPVDLDGAPWVGVRIFADSVEVRNNLNSQEGARRGLEAAQAGVPVRVIGEPPLDEDDGGRRGD